MGRIADFSLYGASLNATILPWDCLQELLNLMDLFRRQSPVGGAYEFLDLPGPAGPDNRGRHRRLAQHPGNRHLARRLAMGHADRPEQFDELEGPRQERLLVVLVLL